MLANRVPIQLFIGRYTCYVTQRRSSHDNAERLFVGQMNEARLRGQHLVPQNTSGALQTSPVAQQQTCTLNAL
jgi:hypothetical protein